jgi:DNA polymerase I-like protein with 3'-5' exonuclease and polymerase domains
VARFRLKKLQKQWKRLRDLAKRCEYGAVYGGDPANLYEALVRDFPELRLAQVQETVALIERQMPGVVRQRQRWEQEARVNREIRDVFLGRVRLFPLGHFDPQVVYNYPIQTAAASLLAFAIFRFVAVTRPELLNLERLYAFGLLDRAWVAKWRMRLLGKPWHGPVNLIVNGHDSLIAECDDEDAPQATALLEDAMTQERVHPVGGWRMKFPGEAASGRRWSDT